MELLSAQGVRTKHFSLCPIWRSPPHTQVSLGPRLVRDFPLCRAVTRQGQHRSLLFLPFLCISSTIPRFPATQSPRRAAHQIEPPNVDLIMPDRLLNPPSSVLSAIFLSFRGEHFLTTKQGYWPKAFKKKNKKRSQFYKCHSVENTFLLLDC